MESTVNLNHSNQSYIMQISGACQALMESRSMFEELTTISRLYQENHALHGHGGITENLS